MSEWNGSYRGHLHFYGHIHDKRDETWEYMNQGENAYNVGCMLYGYGPVRLNEIVKANSDCLRRLWALRKRRMFEEYSAQKGSSML